MFILGSASGPNSIAAPLAATTPAVRIFGHGCDVSYPQSGGRWLGSPLEAKGIPLDAGREIVRLVLDLFSDGLKELDTQHLNYRFLDLRGVVDQGEQSWHDELHSKSTGYGRVADVFRDAIAVAQRTGTLESRAISVGGIPHAPTPFESGPGAVIVLDPGHGGQTPPYKVGGSSWNNATGPQGTLEKTLTLDVALRTRDILSARGRTVVLTREIDVNLGLRARANVAKSREADAFVSIHFNGSTGHNAQGTETFVHNSHIPASTDLWRSSSGRFCRNAPNRASPPPVVGANALGDRQR